MNGEIGTEAAQFPEKERINGIFVAVRADCGNVQTVLLGAIGSYVLVRPSDRQSCN